MLDEEEWRTWERIRRQLNSETATQFCSVNFVPIERVVRARWFPFAMAVIVPLLLPALSVLEMFPADASVGGSLLAVVAVARRLTRQTRIGE